MDIQGMDGSCTSTLAMRTLFIPDRPMNYEPGDEIIEFAAVTLGIPAAESCKNKHMVARSRTTPPNSRESRPTMKSGVSIKITGVIITRMVNHMLC